MKAPIVAGIIAGAIAVTAGGGVSIASAGWPEAVLFALAGLLLAGWYRVQLGMLRRNGDAMDGSLRSVR